jgi:ferredoxin
LPPLSIHIHIAAAGRSQTLRASPSRATLGRLPTIRFETVDAAVEVDLPTGGRLVDARDDVRAPVPLSCRSATCGTCLVEVLEGGALLLPPGNAERELLSLLDAGERERLACQAVARGGSGLVRLRALRPALADF